MADLLRKYKSLYSSTTNSFATGEGVTITPSSVVGLPTSTEIVLTFDRVDSSGTATPTKMERIKGTISGANFVVSSGGRGYDSSTEQTHTSPVVEMVWNAKDWNDSIDAFITQHDQAGRHTDITACTITASGVVTFTSCEVLSSNLRMADTKSIVDGNSNEWLKFSQTASAVNEFTVTNAATGTRPKIAPTGGDTTISGQFAGKSASNSWTGEYDNGNSGSAITINWLNGDRQLLTLSASATLTYSNASLGQTLILRVVENGTGGFSVTLPTSKWPSGTVGTFTTTANAINLLAVYYDGTNYLTQLATGFA